MATGKVMMTCPVTGKAVYTGMSMDEEAFRTETFQETELVCPHCGQTHQWDKQTAYLATDGNKQRPSSRE